MSALFALDGRRRLGLLVVLVLAAVGAGVLLATRGGPGPVAGCERQAADSRDRARTDTGSGRRIVVIGDSWTVGFGDEEPGELWPARLDGRVHVDGWSGSGFSAGATPCEEAQYAERAAAAVGDGADLVVVEGGLNDAGQPSEDIAAGAHRLLDELEGHEVVIVGPPRAPAVGEEADRVDAVLARVAAERGVRYVSTLGWRLPYLPDGLHLTPARHREYGDRVAAALPDPAPDRD